MCLNQYEIQTQLTRLRILVYISYTLSASRCQAEPSTCARATGCVFKKRKMKNDRKCVDISTHVTQLGIGRQVGLTHLTNFSTFQQKIRLLSLYFHLTNEDVLNVSQCPHLLLCYQVCVLNVIHDQTHAHAHTHTHTSIRV